jgi:proteasome accessory factor A
VRDWIFKDQRFGLIDVHQRDWDEPAGNGGFLFNGGRCYIDMGHLEYCTPECLSLLDVLRYDQAGDAILLQAVKAMRLEREINFIRNNIDHYSGATFGCHENYLVRRAAPLTEANVHSLLAFLTLAHALHQRGRVGATLAAEARGELSRPARKSFQISQRADYINNDLFEWVQFNRAIINTRDEPLADARKYRRLHLLHGDTNVLPASLLLKVGTTSLVLDLLENELPAQNRPGRRRRRLPQFVPSTRRPLAGATGRRPLRRRRPFAPAIPAGRQAPNCAGATPKRTCY